MTIDKSNIDFDNPHCQSEHITQAQYLKKLIINKRKEFQILVHHRRQVFGDVEEEKAGLQRAIMVLKSTKQEKKQHQRRSNIMGRYNNINYSFRIRSRLYNMVVWKRKMMNEELTDLRRFNEIETARHIKLMERDALQYKQLKQIMSFSDRMSIKNQANDYLKVIYVKLSQLLVGDMQEFSIKIKKNDVAIISDEQILKKMQQEIYGWKKDIITLKLKSIKLERKHYELNKQQEKNVQQLTTHLCKFGSLDERPSQPMLLFSTLDTGNKNSCPILQSSKWGSVAQFYELDSDRIVRLAETAVAFQIKQQVLLDSFRTLSTHFRNILLDYEKSNILCIITARVLKSKEEYLSENLQAIKEDCRKDMEIMLKKVTIIRIIILFYTLLDSRLKKLTVWGSKNNAEIQASFPDDYHSNNGTKKLIDRNQIFNESNLELLKNTRKFLEILKNRL
ncbi:hypothetical protein SNEBB_010506 [Seison nebaliae]|nr:hypothetical protein SNEBB_010506 [Seison nebaliae]